MQTMGIREIVDELIAHRSGKNEDQMFLRLARYEGDFEKVAYYKRRIAWREAEIRRLSDLLKKQERRMA